MKTSHPSLTVRLSRCIIAFATVLAVSTARFERDPQSCGMINMEMKKKKTGEQRNNS